MWAPELNALTLASAGAAFLAAFSGSLHCLGMCGPLRLVAGESASARLQYEGGRLLAYLILGALAGFAGSALPLWAWVPLITLGLLLGFADERFLPAWKRFRARALAAAGARPLFLGLGSGLLPCGLLHAWVAVAAASGHTASGALLLTLLWAGSLPALELGAAAFRRPLLAARARFPRALPIAFLLLALLPVAWRARMLAASGQAPHACHGAATQGNPNHAQSQ